MRKEPAMNLEEIERRRRVAEADAAAREAERRGDAAEAARIWAQALMENPDILPESLSITQQPALFPPAEADLYAAPPPGKLAAVVARFRYGRLTGRYDYDALCAALVELQGAGTCPAAETLWRELADKSPAGAEAALRAAPDDVAATCAYARHLMAAERFEDARRLLLELLRRRPDALEARPLLADAEARLLDDDAFARSRLDAARRLMADEAYEAALAELRAARRRLGDRPDALALLSHCLAEAGRLEEAEEAAARAVKADENDAAARLALGEAYRRQGRLEAAAAELDRCAALAGESSELGLQAREVAASAYAELGERAYLQGELDEAARRFQAALERDPANPTALPRMARLAELCDDHASAASLWRQAADAGAADASWRARVCELLADGSDEALLDAGERCMQAGDIRWAERILSRVKSPQLREEAPAFAQLTSALDELDAHCGRAWDWMAQGKTAQAKEIFEKLEPVCPADPRVLRGLGFALASEAETAHGRRRLELRAEARDKLKQAIAYDPRSDEAEAARERLRRLAGRP